MYKLLSLLLALLLLPAAASADVLADGWQDATLEELLAAQAVIADQVSQLRAASSDASDALVYSGEGTSILTGVSVDQIPARLTIDGAAKVTLTGASKSLKYNAAKAPRGCELLTDAGTYDLLVECDGAWTVTIEPLKAGGSIVLSGTGPYVSDYFELPGAAIISYDVTQGSSGWLTAQILLGHQYVSINGWTYDTVLNRHELNPGQYAGDAIAAPTPGRDLYYWIISVPADATWSIVLK